MWTWVAVGVFVGLGVLSVGIFLGAKKLERLNYGERPEQWR